MVRKINNGYYALRWKILERDNFTCQYCGQYAPNIQLEVDHILAVEDGGTDDPENLKTSCFACNRGKSGLRIIQTRSRKALPYLPSGPTNFRSMEILNALAISPLSATELAKQLNVSENNIRVLLCRLVDKGSVMGKSFKDELKHRWIMIYSRT